jgi:uncharacterized protein (TIGR02246 family)
MGNRRRWKQLLFVAAAWTAAAAGGYLAVRSQSPAAADEHVRQAPTPGDPATAEDEKALRENQAAYVKTFNAGDAKALAAFWTPDGEFVDAEGRSFRGRAAIEKEFAAFFAQEKGLTLEISPDSLRFVGPGVALESGSSRVTRGSDTARTSAAYSIVHSKRDGRWQLASVRELPYAAAATSEHLRDLEWLVGNWTAKKDGKSVDMSCEWTQKRNFLTRRYTIRDTNGTVATGIQIIGWDPLLGGIRSWLFDSEGGFGSEQWIKDNQRWVLEASGVTRDGVPTTATNIITRLDPENFTWQSVERHLGQTTVPNTAVIKVTRVKAKK